jgi:hypothetical protein
VGDARRKQRAQIGVGYGFWSRHGG